MICAVQDYTQEMICAVQDYRQEMICVVQDYISDLCTAVLNGEMDDFALECLGVLANLSIPDLDYELILKEYDMIPWIKSKLQPGACHFFFL